MGLWGSEFEVKQDDKKLLNKLSSPKVVTSVDRQLKSKKLSVEDRLNIITENVNKILGHYKDNTLVIKTREELHEYITNAINDGRIAIDTETNNSLDPLTCKIMGGCIYSPSQKQAYIPINHVDFRTKERLSWQLTEEDLREEFSRLSNTKIIMHNGKFDYQVIKCTCGAKLSIYWDTMICARLLNENERAGLKQQYIDKIDSSQEKYSIDHLFENVEYAWVEPSIFALYSATDAFMTDKLYLWQKERIETKDNKKLFDLFMNVEMPMVEVTAEMEMLGIELDLPYAKKLSEKYHVLSDKVNKKIEEELSKYQTTIDKWKMSKEGQTIKGKKRLCDTLDNPLKTNSPSQLATFLYDILKVQPVSKDTPRGVGVDELTAISKRDKIRLCDLVLEQREYDKLLSTYIDKLPEIVSTRDGRLHGHFNQLGTDTGRFSSSDPNLQNIPSHNTAIRLMFKARNNFSIVGGDFSAQEPRLTSNYSKCPTMLQAYRDNKDLYSVIAQSMYNNKYEDNLEFYPQGTKIIIDGHEHICGNKTDINEEGKKRRKAAKTVLLGILYGRGAQSIGEQLGADRQRGQEIIDTFFKSFPEVKSWVEESKKKAYKYGYVEDFRGRRRHLPELELPPYVAEYKNKDNDLIDFTPFIECDDKMKSTKELEKYVAKCNEIKYKRDFYDLQREADKNGIKLSSNTNKIAQAERQSVNAIVQGGASTLTKMAMIKIYHDEELNRLGFKMMITVHDEVLGECPTENSELVAKRLVEVMCSAGEKYLDVPMKVDTYNVKHWYEPEYSTEIHDEYESYMKKFNEDKDKAFDEVCNEHSELPRECLNRLLFGDGVLTF